MVQGVTTTSPESAASISIKAELERMAVVYDGYVSQVSGDDQYQRLRGTRSLALNSLCVVLRAQGRALPAPTGKTKRPVGVQPIHSNCGYFELPDGEYPQMDELFRFAREAAKLRDANLEIPNYITAEHTAFAERLYAEAVAWIEEGR